MAAGAAVVSRATSVRADRHSTSLRTRLSRELGLRVPIVSAGMAFVGLEDLTVAVSNAGGLGVYGVGGEPPPVFEARLANIEDRTSRPYGVDFLVDTAATGPFTTQDHIDIAADHHVPVVVFHWNLPDPAWVEQLHDAGSRVWVQTGDVRLAQRAVHEGADGVIAQGRSAGGHNRNSQIPTWRLVAEMRRALPRETLILAAGGVADGQGLVRALRAGADGGWAGTVFAAAAESYAHPGYKARLVAAQAPSATEVTTVFGPEWPGQPQRVLRNRATMLRNSALPAKIGDTMLAPGVLNIGYEMPKHSAFIPTRDTRGDLDEMDMPAGSESLRAIRSVRPARDIVADFLEDGQRACDRDDRRSVDED